MTLHSQLSRLAAVAVTVFASSVVLASPANADDRQFEIVGTDIGIYPRAGTSMGSERVGDVLSDGDMVTVVCEAFGEEVDNGYAPTAVWAKTVNSTFLPTAFILTGAEGRTPGVPECGSDVAPPDATESYFPYCGQSEYVNEITVTRWDNDQFTIHVWVNEEVRKAINPWAVTESAWHAVQACVTGLYGSLADSIWDQLECHQILAPVPDLRDWSMVSQGLFPWATGMSYDLESWRGTFNIWDLTLRCGNALHTELDRDPADATFSGNPADSLRGTTDLEGAWNNVS